MNLLKTTLGAVLLSGATFLGVAAGASPLETLNDQYIQEIQANHQTVSHKAGLVRTLDRILDCAAAGRITVALVGLGVVPERVVEVWRRHEPAPQEVSISHYQMILEEGKPLSRTDFFRFRTVRDNGTVSEILLQDLPREKRAAIILELVDGDPTGQEKALSGVLIDLLACVEEGQIRLFKTLFQEVPQRVHDLWRFRVDPRLQNEEVAVERFEADNPDGIGTYWRLAAETAPGHCRQVMLIFKGRIVYDSLNDQIKTE